MQGIKAAGEKPPLFAKPTVRQIMCSPEWVAEQKSMDSMLLAAEP